MAVEVPSPSLIFTLTTVKLLSCNCTNSGYLRKQLCSLLLQMSDALLQISHLSLNGLNMAISTHTVAYNHHQNRQYMLLTLYVPLSPAVQSVSLPASHLAWLLLIVKSAKISQHNPKYNFSHVV